MAKSSPAYMREYMRQYRVQVDCHGCGTVIRVNKTSKAHLCNECRYGEDLKLTPDACLDCGIRPLAEYDSRPGYYVPVIVDGYCDDCRLRRRRQQEYWGSEAWRAAHTPRFVIEGVFVPEYEPKPRRATELTIYGSSGRDAY